MLEYDNNYIRRLIQLDLVGGLSPEEKGKLEDWINESEEHRLLFCKIKKQLSINEIRNYLQTDVEDAWKKVREKTFGAPPVRPRRGLKWLKYAAVVLPVSLSLSLWYTWKEKMENKQATVACLSPVLTLDNGEKYQDKLLNDKAILFGETDPDFAKFFADFAFDDVVNQNDLDDKTRMMVILATLIGCQGRKAFESILPDSLKMNVTPVEIKEIIYQAVAYLGIGRVADFLEIANDCFKSLNINLPLEAQSTTTRQTRLEKGIQAQVDIFGENMKDFWKSGDSETRHINRWLAENCFGDYYTRKGLDLKQREMITFCFILAQGGCENQLTAHIQGNLNVGNDKEFLLKVLTQCLPYIGYPRSLNALACIKKVCDK